MTAQTIVIETDADGEINIRIPQQRTPARHQPLLISAYLVERGMPIDRVRRCATTFGKLLRAEYLKEHGREPEKAERWIGGQNRSVAAYTTADRKLFDRAFRFLRP